MSKNNKGKKGSFIGVKNMSKKLLVGEHIKNELNKLFYEKPKYNEELKMLKYQYDQEEEERIGLHASAITGAGKNFCYREQVLSLFYKQAQGENIPINLKRIFEEGKSIGTKWQRLFIRGGIAKKEDLDVSRFVKEYDLSYTPDGIIELNGKRYVVEIKSMNTFGFSEAKSHPSGQKQLKLYIYFESKVQHIDGGFVLVEDKNNQDFKVFMEFDIDETDKDISEFIDKLEMIQYLKSKFIKEKKPPKRHKDCISSTCKMASKCNMRDACWNVGMGRVKINKE